MGKAGDGNQVMWMSVRISVQAFCVGDGIILLYFSVLIWYNGLVESEAGTNPREVLMKLDDFMKFLNEEK